MGLVGSAAQQTLGQKNFVFFPRSNTDFFFLPTRKVNFGLKRINFVSDFSSLVVLFFGFQQLRRNTLHIDCRFHFIFSIFFPKCACFIHYLFQGLMEVVWWAVVGCRLGLAGHCGYMIMTHAQITLKTFEFTVHLFREYAGMIGCTISRARNEATFQVYKHGRAVCRTGFQFSAFSGSSFNFQKKTGFPFR